MAGLHRKDKIDAYLALMVEEKSLDKIKDALNINKKTAFDWRHKILSSLGDGAQDDFTGITESDEAFFPRSEKGNRDISRKPRKRGGASSKKGVNDEHVAVIVTRDRKSTMDNQLGHHALKGIIKQRVKEGIYHIQHVKLDP